MEPNPMKTDISHFEMGRTLGRGGFGVVRAGEKVTDPGEGIWFAIKMISKESVVRKNSFEEVFREVHFLHTLKHRFICNAHFAFQDEQNLYLVMDCAFAGNLRYHLKYVTLGEGTEKVKEDDGEKEIKGRNKKNEHVSWYRATKEAYWAYTHAMVHVPTALRLGVSPLKPDHSPGH